VCVCAPVGVRWLTSSVSNMVRLEEKGELVLSRISQGLSKDMVAKSRAREARPVPGPEPEGASPPLTRTHILTGEVRARERGREGRRESERAKPDSNWIHTCLFKVKISIEKLCVENSVQMRAWFYNYVDLWEILLKLSELVLGLF